MRSSKSPSSSSSSLRDLLATVREGFDLGWGLDFAGRVATFVVGLACARGLGFRFALTRWLAGVGWATIEPGHSRGGAGETSDSSERAALFAIDRRSAFESALTLGQIATPHRGFAPRALGVG